MNKYLSKLREDDFQIQSLKSSETESLGHTNKTIFNFQMPAWRRQVILQFQI